MTAALTILRAARELLSDEKRWTKGAYQRTASGWAWNSDPSDPPTCWCLAGSLVSVAPKGPEGTNAAYRAREVLEELIGARCDSDDDSVEWWNDDEHRRHSDVLALLDQAIAREAAL